jgi:putative ABC transport system ATP-binding protein
VTSPVPDLPPDQGQPRVDLASGTADTALSATGVVKTYGRGRTAVTALDGIDVSFRRSAFHAITGPSGSGKSTLMHCLAGLDSVSAGVVRLGGTVLTDLKDKELTLMRRRRVGFVFQSFNLLPMLTAEQNILLPLELGRRHGDAVDRGWLAELVGVLGIASRLSHRPAELSGGEQQRVAIARALITRPDVVFADEPTGNLDSRSGQDLLGFLRHSVEHLGQTVVMVTHDPAAATQADHVLLLADGRVAGTLNQPTSTSVTGALESLRLPPVTAPVGLP